MKMQLSKHCMS